MKIASLIAVMVCSAHLMGEEVVSTDLNSSADQLDKMVRQDKMLRKVTREPNGTKSRELIPPLNVERIAAAAAPKLKLEKAQLAATLRDGQKTLSEVVMARALEESIAKSWKDLLASNDRAQLIAMVEEKKLTEKVRQTLDELYTEVSFVALDRLQNDGTAVGKAPGGEKGKGKEKKAAK
jgi:hypothetical protein